VCGQGGGLYDVAFEDGIFNMWMSAKFGLHNKSSQLAELKPARIDIRMVLLSCKLYGPFSLPGSIEQLRRFWARCRHHCCHLFHCVRFKITGLGIRKHKRGGSVGEKKGKH
jgi:hypothetical protein